MSRGNEFSMSIGESQSSGNPFKKVKLIERRNQHRKLRGKLDNFLDQTAEKLQKNEISTPDTLELEHSLTKISDELETAIFKSEIRHQTTEELEKIIENLEFSKKYVSDGIRTFDERIHHFKQIEENERVRKVEKLEEKVEHLITTKSLSAGKIAILRKHLKNPFTSNAKLIFRTCDIDIDKL